VEGTGVSARALDILVAARRAKAAIESLLDVTGWGHEPALSRALDTIVLAEDTAAAAIRKGQPERRGRTNTKPPAGRLREPSLERLS
jgi:hypothetical protein